jgi:ABC-type transporter Mla subunit MlaD
MNLSGSDRSERWVGMFVVVALLLLVAGFGYHLYHTAEKRGWFVPRCPYYTFVQNADGLEVGEPVMLMGFEVGNITVIEAEPPGSWYNVFVGFEIKRPYYGYIWSDSRVKVATVGLLGRQLEIIKGVAGRPTVYEKDGRPHQVLVGTNRVDLAQNPKGAFLLPEESASVTERAEKLLADAEAALPNLLALTNRLNGVLDSANVLLTNTSALMVRLDQTAEQLSPVLSNATIITGHLTDPHGSLGDWLLTDELDAHIATLVASLNATLLNLADITSNLNAQVQSNDQILSEISTLVINTDDLVQGLKRHWLLRGAFGRRDRTAAPASGKAATP